MKQVQRRRTLRSFCSVVMILMTLFALLFCKMEVRRLDLAIWEMSRTFDRVVTENRWSDLAYQRLVSSERVTQRAQQKLALRLPDQNQVFRILGDGLFAKN